jgi:hypothetical protein
LYLANLWLDFQIHNMKIVPLAIRRIASLGQQTDVLRQMAEHTKQLERQELWDPVALPNECRYYLLPPLWNIVQQYLEPRLMQKLIEKQGWFPYIATWWSDGERGKRIRMDWKFRVKDLSDRYNCEYQTSSVYGKNTLKIICWDRGMNIDLMWISINTLRGCILEATMSDSDDVCFSYRNYIEPEPTYHNETIPLRSFGLDRTTVPRFDRNGTIHGDLRTLDPIVAHMIQRDM